MTGTGRLAKRHLCNMRNREFQTQLWGTEMHHHTFGNRPYHKLVNSLCKQRFGTQIRGWSFELQGRNRAKTGHLLMKILEAALALILKAAATSKTNLCSYRKERDSSKATLILNLLMCWTQLLSESQIFFTLVSLHWYPKQAHHNPPADYTMLYNSFHVTFSQSPTALCFPCFLD